MKHKSILFTVVILLFFALLTEVIFRVIFPVPEISNFNRINYSPLFFGTEAKKVKYLSNAEFVWESEPDGKGYVSSLNLYGFRDDDEWEVGKQNGLKKAIFVGDSFCEGFMAPQDSTIPALFEQLAYENYIDLEVMNMGIGGNKFPGYFNLVNDATAIFKPDYLLLIINSNDFPAGDYSGDLTKSPISPEFNSFLTPRIFKVVSEYMSGKTVAKAWKSEPFNFFAPVPSIRNPWSISKNEEEWSQFVSPKVMNAMKQGKANPFSANEWDKYEKNLRDSINVSAYFSALRNFSDMNDMKTFIIYVPSRSQVSDSYLEYQAEFSKSTPASLMGEEYQLHSRILSKLCSHIGLEYIDLTPIFRNVEKGKRLYWGYDEHLNSEGYKQAASEIYKRFKESH